MLEIKNFTKILPDHRIIFEKVNLCLKEKECVFIMGKSGSGKSLFLKSIVNLTNHQGEVLFNGKIPGNILAFRKQVQYLSANFPLESQSVESYLKRPYQFSIYEGQKMNYEKFLEEFKLDKSFLKKRLGFLSGGEKQMIKLIRALSLGPKVLLLDEPVSAMDPQTKKLAVQALENSLKDTSYLWVTHEPPCLAGAVYEFPKFLLKDI